MKNESSQCRNLKKVGGKVSDKVKLQSSISNWITVENKMMKNAKENENDENGQNDEKYNKSQCDKIENVKDEDKNVRKLSQSSQKIRR